MAKKMKKKMPPKATTSKKRKSSPSIVTPTKEVKKGESTTTAGSKRVKTVSWLLLSLLSLLSSSLLPLSPSSLLPLPVSTALSLSNHSTTKKKKVKDATMPSGLLSKLSHKLKTDNIEVSPMAEKKLVFDNITKIKLKNYKIDWFNPVVISSESLKYLKKNDCPTSTHESQLLFLINKFELGEIKLSFSNAIGKLGKAAHKCLGIKKRSNQDLFN
jgi:hypothetical protein